MHVAVHFSLMTNIFGEVFQLSKGCNLVIFWQNSQFSPQTITQSSISFLNYENSRFSPQTFTSGSISSLTYENGDFGPQTFASGKFIPGRWPNTLFTLLLSLRITRCWRVGVVGRPPLRRRRGLASPSQSAPMPHPRPASAAVAPKIRACRRMRRCRRGGFGGAASCQTGGAVLRGDDSDSEEQREQRVPQQLVVSDT
jgi:hypothetical protein